MLPGRKVATLELDRLVVPALLAQWQSSGLLIRKAQKLVGPTKAGDFNLAGGVTKMSGSRGATRNSTASIPLLLQIPLLQ